MPMDDAAKIGDLFITVTGDKQVINADHFTMMRDGAILANSGHFDVEIDIAALKKMAKKVEAGVTRNVDAYLLPNGRRVYLLGEGRLVNLACAEGHPAQVMDMSFATQALSARWAARRKSRLEVRVHNVPPEIEDEVARLKLAAMGIRIDTLTEAQRHYLTSWESGT